MTNDGEFELLRLMEFQQARASPITSNPLLSTNLRDSRSLI